jgi:hypothetical protein
VPHLIDRVGVSIFRFRTPSDAVSDGAEYLLLESNTDDVGAYPSSVDNYAATLERVRRSTDYVLQRELDGILLFRRRNVSRAEASP